MKNEKIYIFCTRHDENLLSLYQEAQYIGYEVCPIYLNKIHDSLIKNAIKTITINDYIIILHIPFGSQHLKAFISQFKYKKCLNQNAFSKELIGNKLYQQKQVGLLDPKITIKTYTKSTITNNIQYPLIAKPADASCGYGIKLINNYHQIVLLDNNYIIQPYIINDGDWRVVVIGNKAISAIKRIGKTNQVTNNIATGSFAMAENNKKLLDIIYPIAELASKSMDFDYVGVDIIKDINTGHFYFLETNERPTFETSQILTGINISKTIIQYLVS